VAALPRNVTWGRAEGEPWNGVKSVMVDGKPVGHVRPHADGWEALALDRQPLATFPTIDAAVMHVTSGGSAGGPHRHSAGDGIDIQGSFLKRKAAEPGSKTVQQASKELGVDEATVRAWMANRHQTVSVERRAVAAKIAAVGQDRSLTSAAKQDRLKALHTELQSLPQESAETGAEPTTLADWVMWGALAPLLVVKPKFAPRLRGGDRL
jgi:hypothetical protein